MVSMKVKTGMPNFSASFIRRRGLAVALGAGHAEVAQRALFGISAALVTDDHAGLAIEARNAAHDGSVVVGKVAVAVRLGELGETSGAIVEVLRTLRVPGDLVDLPRRQVGVDVLGELLALFGQPVDLFGDVTADSL